MGDSIWLLVVCCLAIFFVVLITPSALYEARRAYQHKYGGQAQKELYTGDYERPSKWRRVAIYASPYSVLLFMFAVAGCIGWLVIDSLVAVQRGDLPITYRAVFSRFPNPDGTLLDKESVALQSVEIVNQSKNNMSLSFALAVRLETADGQQSGLIEPGEWRHHLGDQNGIEILNIGAESTENGVLLFRLPDLEMWQTFKGQDWRDVGEENMVLKIHDRVSGEEVMCSPNGYPPEIDFPPNYASMNPGRALGLLFRIAGHYSTDDEVVFQPAVLTNQTHRKMSLSFRLHVKNAGHEVTHALIGEWHDWGTSGNWHDSPGQDILAISADSSLKGMLVFTLPKPEIANVRMWNVEFVALEIHDRVSGSLVLCDPEIGYPPAIKRSFLDVRSPTD